MSWFLMCLYHLIFKNFFLLYHKNISQKEVKITWKYMLKYYLNQQSYDKIKWNGGTQSCGGWFHLAIKIINSGTSYHIRYDVNKTQLCKINTVIHTKGQSENMLRVGLHLVKRGSLLIWEAPFFYCWLSQ